MCVGELVEAFALLDTVQGPSELSRRVPQLACEILKYSRAVLALINDEEMRIVSAHFADAPDKAAVVLRQTPALSPGGVESLLTELTSAPEARMINGAAAEGMAVCRQWLELDHCAVVPLISDGEVNGLLAVGSPQKPAHLEQCLQGLDLFARGVAMAHTKLIWRVQAREVAERSRRRIAELAVHQIIGGVLRSATNLEQIPDILVNEIRNVLTYDAAVAAVSDDSGKQWLRSSRGVAGQALDRVYGSIDRLNATDLAPTIASVVLEASKLPQPLSSMALPECESHLYVPMRTQDETLGFVLLGLREPDVFLDTDLRFVSALVETTSAHVSALKAQERLKGAFAEIGNALASGLDLEETLQIVVEIAATITQADGASFLMHDEADDVFVVKARYGLGESYPIGATIPASATLALRVVREGRRRVVAYASEAGAVIPTLTGHDTACSIIVSPVIVSGVVQGVIEVYSSTPNYFRASDADLMDWFADRAAVAFTNTQAFVRERRIAETFQTSLLVEPRPELEDFDIATRYQAAFEEAGVGGDFYDFVPLSRGKLGVVVGDVSGKGLRAAVYTAMAKYTLRAYAIESPTPSGVLARLNNALCGYLEDGMFITLFYGVIDINSSTLTYSSAGHESPLLYCPGTPGIQEKNSQGPVLGLICNADFAEETLEMEPGCSILVYTDGAIDAGSKGVYLGIGGLKLLFEKCATKNATDTVDILYQEITDFAGGKLRDDVVLMNVRRC